MLYKPKYARILYEHVLEEWMVKIEIFYKLKDIKVSKPKIGKK